MRSITPALVLAHGLIALPQPVAATVGVQNASLVRTIVDKVALPLMRNNHIPGLAIGLTISGRRYFFEYGVESRATGQSVTNGTLFEIGSISKTFTATLASYAQLDGRLSWSDRVGKHLAVLRGTAFGDVRLINLATHTTGGLPLQVPDAVTDINGLLGWLRHWQPDHAPGTYRTYSNISIGLLGHIAADSLHLRFEEAVERKLFPALGLSGSFIDVPAQTMNRYAQGYAADDGPVRASPGVLGPEAYGVKSCSADMVRFIEANLGASIGNAKWERAIQNTHGSYFASGALTQDLIWEQYPYPVDLKRLLDGNSSRMITGANPAERLSRPLPPPENVLIDKTGSTRGFGAYVAFIPGRRLGIVILANKNYPIPARVTAAFEILTKVDELLGG